MKRQICIFPLFVLGALILLTAAAPAASNPGSKNATMVDEGTFGIFQAGQRVATETFSVRQFPDHSVTSSHLHTEAAAGSAAFEQTAELTLLANGNLVRYEWKQLAPAHNTLTVDSNDSFLVMHSVTDGKAAERSFFLTSDVFVLDDLFFVAREVLLWRYLGSSCQPNPNGDGCTLVKGRFPILIPRRQASAQVFIEFKGYDDTPLNGRPQHLRHFVLQSEGPDWHFWMDSNYKLLRISIPENNTEVLRQ
jgi:hypothetical protein